jgi:hypothetical protein
VTKEAPTPVFVIGPPRSGTTTLANLLSEHPEIAGVTSPAHIGIVESHFFSHTRYALPRYCDCVEFFERYRAEDYCVVADVKTEELCRGWDGTKSSTIEYFSLLMEEVARKKGARYWIEKTPKHTVYYQELLQHFPRAKFVLIDRPFRDAYLSNIVKYRSRFRMPPVLLHLAKVFRYSSDIKAMRLLESKAPERIAKVDFHAMVSNTDGEIAKVLRFLELGERSLPVRYGMNTSHTRKRKDEVDFPEWQWRLIEIAMRLMTAMPFPLVKWLRTRYDKMNARKYPLYTLAQVAGKRMPQ